MRHSRFVAFLFALSLVSARGQFGPGAGGAGGPPSGPRFSSSTARLFGDNANFSATLEMQTQSAGEAVTLPGKLVFAEGKSRFEMDMTQIRGGRMPPNAAAQMKSIGMDRMITISRPDKKVAYSIYPGLAAYLENPLRESDGTAAVSDFKVETTELGKETLDGHACVKNRTVVTNGKGEKHEAVVWNATDLKNFPVKIEQTQEGSTVTMVFKEVSLTRPDAAVFDPPSDFKRYENMQAMMQETMMKRFGGGQGFPPRNR